MTVTETECRPIPHRRLNCGNGGRGKTFGHTSKPACLQHDRVSAFLIVSALGDCDSPTTRSASWASRPEGTR